MTFTDARAISRTNKLPVRRSGWSDPTQWMMMMLMMAYVVLQVEIQMGVVSLCSTSVDIGLGVDLLRSIKEEQRGAVLVVDSR